MMIMNLKNDKERVAFLEDYRNEENGWYCWYEVPATERRWWRYDLPDCALIVEEDRRTFTYPYPRTEWFPLNWFVIRAWNFQNKTFRDQVASRSLALKEIKRVQREAKDGK